MSLWLSYSACQEGHISKTGNADRESYPPAGSGWVGDRLISDLGESGTRLPDALIAVTALERGFSVVTRNRKYFAPIRGIRVRSID